MKVRDLIELEIETETVHVPVSLDDCIQSLLDYGFSSSRWENVKNATQPTAKIQLIGGEIGIDIFVKTIPVQVSVNVFVRRNPEINTGRFNLYIYADFSAIVGALISIVGRCEKLDAICEKRGLVRFWSGSDLHPRRTRPVGIIVEVGIDWTRLYSQHRPICGFDDLDELVEAMVALGWPKVA